MKYGVDIKIFQFILFVIGLFVFYGVQASLSNDQKGKILDNFKARQQELLFETDVGEFSSDDLKVFDISKRANIYGNIAEKLQYERGTIEDKHIYELSKILSLQESLDVLNQDIEHASTTVDKINGQVIEVKKDIEVNKKSLELLRDKIGENRKILLKYLQYIYKKSNNVYAGDEFDNLKTILLNNQDVSEVINDLYYKSIIQVKGKELIDNQKKLIAEMYMTKIELEKKEGELKQLRKLAIIDRKVLNDKKEFKQRLLKVSEGKQALYEKFIENRIEVEKKVKLQAFKEQIRFDKVQRSLLDKYGCKYVDLSQPENNLLDVSGKCLELNKVLYAEQRLKKTTIKGVKPFDWPVNPKLGISAFYKGENYRRIFGSDHEAIDVVANQGTPLKAPADGYVIYLNEPDSLEYSFLALKHADGFVTVYGHLSEIGVQQFDYVRKGQVFAKTGGEYATKGAGLMTTGPHLHFEVFKNEESIDPLTVLDLSYANYSNLPPKYQIQFENDFRVRKGYDYAKAKKSGRVFRLNGYSEIERQKDLITRYTHPNFRNWEMWVDESLNGSIDPTFAMCIGLAETGLGRNLKTPYNVGNIGNTDSGAVREFRSAREGIYAMIRTLNNRYLGHYTQINQLSRYGNPDGTIYASSPDHWHNNIIKCMSAIKGYQVPDDYNFRLGQ